MPERYPGSIAAAYVNASANICADNGPGSKPDALRRRQTCYDNKIEALDNVLRRLCPIIASQISRTRVDNGFSRIKNHSHSGHEGGDGRVRRSSRVGKIEDSNSRSFRRDGRQLGLQNSYEWVAEGASLSPCLSPSKYPYSGGVVVHVRLGDSFCATTTYAREALRPPPARDVARVVEAALEADATAQERERSLSQQRQALDQSLSPSPCTVVYSAHGGCLNATSAYVTQLMELLGNNSSSSSSSGARCVLEEGVGWRAADKHLCAMVNARNFVQGSGGFSYLAERVRARRSRQQSDLNQAGGSALPDVTPQSNNRSIGASTSTSNACLESWPTWQALVRTPIVWLDAHKELAKREAEDVAKVRTNSN